MNSKDVIIPHDEDIQSYVSVNLKLLSLMGIKVSLSKSDFVQKNKFVNIIPSLLVILLQVYCAICQVLLMVEAAKVREYIIATEIGSDLFSNILISAKGCRLVIAMDQVNLVLQDLTTCWRKYVPGHKIRSQVLSKAHNIRLVCKLFVAMVFCGIPIYGLPSFINVVSIYMHQNVENYTADFYKRVFFMKYPFPVNNPLTYFFVILEEEYLLFGVVLFWMCSNILFAQLTTHASLQFEILRSDIESLMDEKITDSTFKVNIAILIERHKHLLSICDRIESIYSPAILIIMVLSGLNICFNIFDIIEMLNTAQYKSAILHSYLLLNTLFEISFYCIFAETLTEQTRTIGDTIYNSNWTQKNHKLNFYVYMLIIKSQHPFYCTAYGFFPIGHIRLSKTINAALSYFMMLRATT